jgi:hypothetical protein
MNPGMVQAPSSAMPMQNGPHDAQGNRLDARGNIISPQTR